MSDCIERSKLKLKPHQIRIIKSKENGIIVVHPTGYGKTLTAVAYSQCFLDEYPDREVIFVAPASLLSNFRKELKNYGVENIKKYKIYSYQKFVRLSTSLEGNDKDYDNLCKNDLLIIDEAHNLRNLKGVNAKEILKCAFKAKKRLLLTATPFINELKDFEFLIDAVYGHPFLIPGEGKRLRKLDELRHYLKGKIDYIKVSKKDKELFPKFTEKYVKIPMPKEYEKKYCDVIRGKEVDGTSFANPGSFYNAHRRAVNKIGTEKEYISMKMDKTIELIGESKALIYTNWLKYGTEPIMRDLKKVGIKAKVYSGELNEKSKNKIIKDFNEDKFQVLIVTSTGKEGLDLKGVRKLIVMDPVWNFSGIEQIKGRAVRLGSHIHLPKDERKVDIYYLILATKDDYKGSKVKRKKCLSGDNVVYKFVERKKELQGKINEMMKELSYL